LCGRAAYELANIYLARGDLDKAMEAFAEAGGSRDSSLAKKGNAKLAALEKLGKLRQPDSTGKVPAAARYAIAELFQFDLEAPDSAYYYYTELASAPDADSLVRPRAMLMAAIVARSGLRDAAKADSLFDLVIKKYEGTEFARRAQIEKDVEVTVVTPREAAERDFRAAEALTETDMVAAVKALYAVYKEHPGIEDVAARSLYAAAWYTDNNLHRKRAAMTLYEELCEKFPETDLCKLNAKPRITVARDSMEVRRKRREEAKTAEAAAADSTKITVPAPAGGGKDEDEDGEDDDL
jgi:tetratricopeptide (TPR) repeat protein